MVAEWCGVRNGPAIRQATAGELAGDGMDHRDFEQLCRRERRKNGGKACGEHGFSRTGRADHQKIVVTGGRDFQGPLGAFLAADIGKIRQIAGRAPGLPVWDVRGPGCL
jgi:hypothetical protein